MEKQLVLASNSKWRKQVMEQAGYSFRVVPSDFDERKVKEKVPEKLVQKLAVEKARLIAKQLNNSVVLGADTMLVHNNKMYGKPKNLNEAREVLRSMSNKVHYLITGYAIIDSETKREYSDVVVTEVKMKELTDELIDWYISTGEPLDKAGSYGIQSKGCLLIDKVNGCFFNVVGMPISRVMEKLKEFGVEPK